MMKELLILKKEENLFFDNNNPPFIKYIRKKDGVFDLRIK